MAERKYDSTVARIAGNLMSAIDWYGQPDDEVLEMASQAVLLARAIVAETKRTEPEPVAQ